jgi:hypothetical protein
VNEVECEATSQADTTAFALEGETPVMTDLAATIWWRGPGVSSKARPIPRLPCATPRARTSRNTSAGCYSYRQVERTFRRQRSPSLPADRRKWCNAHPSSPRNFPSSDCRPYQSDTRQRCNDRKALGSLLPTFAVRRRSSLRSLPAEQRAVCRVQPSRPCSRDEMYPFSSRGPPFLSIRLRM